MVSLSLLIIVSLLQGLLEWLPVSSEGQNVLVLISFVGDPDLALSFSLFLHLGTCFAVLVYYRHLIVKLITPRYPERETTYIRRILFYITLGTSLSGTILASALR
ncbi:MAG: undecaprenyl-diphosphate phosphatase [Candidatus Heimdallarchaeota archaeon]